MVKNKKVKSKQIKRKSDKELEEEAMLEENISIFSFVLLTIGLIVLAVFLGMLLYNLAMNNSI